MNLIIGGIRGAESGWKRSSFCNNGACVELSAESKVIVRITDSKIVEGDRPIIEVDSEVWNSFANLLSDDVDELSFGCIRMSKEKHQKVELTDGATTLVYSREEWNAFIKEIENGDLRVRETVATIRNTDIPNLSESLS